MNPIRHILLIALTLCMTGCSVPDTLPEDTSCPGESITASYPAPTEEESQPPATETTQQTEPAPTEIPLPVQPEPEDGDFVRVRDYIPDIAVDLRYAGINNFTGQKIYEFSELWLRYGTVKKLIPVQEALKQRGLCLKVWDGFRPTSAQFTLWDVYPDPAYVANPQKGFSSHSRGNTVDITLVHTDGTEVIMPTGFDDFSALADRDYSDCTREAAENALLLEQTMTAHGFKPYSGEWWHFSDTDAYPVEQSFTPMEASRYYADCNEFISLRTSPNTAANAILRIRAYEEFWVLAIHGDFALIEYRGLPGYVLRQYIYPVQ